MGCKTLSRGGGKIKTQQKTKGSGRILYNGGGGLGKKKQAIQTRGGKGREVVQSGITSNAEKKT